MPSRSRPHGQDGPARNDVNRAIRELMDEPPSPERTARWACLLALWADLAHDDSNAARAA